MKIEIDLKDVLTEEFGDNASLAEIIKEQIIKGLTATLNEGIKNKINEEIGKLIDSEIKSVVSSQMPSLLNELIDKEYTVVTSWGERKETTTLRNNLLKTLTEQMVYRQERYESDKNYFTKSIDAIFSAKMDEFKKSFDTKVNEVFCKEAMDYAVSKLSAKLGLSGK